MFGLMKDLQSLSQNMFLGKHILFLLSQNMFLMGLNKYRKGMKRFKVLICSKIKKLTDFLNQTIKEVRHNR